MSQRPGIKVTQSQRLQLNPQLHAAIRLLQTDAIGLTRYLEEQATSNPHLRLDAPPTPAVGEWLPRWNRVFVGGFGGMAGPASGAETGEIAGPGASLMAHVLGIIDRRMQRPQDRRIALALAEVLEPSGWLGRMPEAIATTLGCDLAEVERVLLRLQEIEPVGLFARNLAECLTLQAAEAGCLDAVMAVVLHHLDLLGRGEIARLARLAHTDEAGVRRAFHLIRRMDPKPGTQFMTFGAAPLREPDLLVQEVAGGGWEVSLNRSSLPGLRIDAAAEGPAGALAAARAVQRMVAARNDTVLRVGRAVLQHQRRALEQGPGHLLPLSMAEVGSALGLHESTISRVVAGVCVDTPQGTWWLRRLFSGGVGGDDTTAVAAAALRDRLARLIAAEDRANPASDEALAEMLRADGPVIARRTVAKYRKMLHIPPAHARRVKPV